MVENNQAFVEPLMKLEFVCVCVFRSIVSAHVKIVCLYYILVLFGNSFYQVMKFDDIENYYAY